MHNRQQLIINFIFLGSVNYENQIYNSNLYYFCNVRNCFNVYYLGKCYKMEEQQEQELILILEEIDKNLNEEIKKLINLLIHEDIENINLYNFYIKINDLLTKRNITKDKIIHLRLSNY